MIDHEEFMRDLANALEDGYDIENFLSENDIEAKEVDSYVSDADDHGYVQHDIWKVEDEEPFYFIYEWNTYHHGGPAAIFLAQPYETTRYYTISDDFREMVRYGE